MASSLLSGKRVLVGAVGVLVVNSLLPIGVARWAGAVMRPVVDAVLLPVRWPLRAWALSWGEEEAGEALPGEGLDCEELLEEYHFELVKNERLTQQVAELRRQQAEVAVILEMVEEGGVKPVAVRVANVTDPGGDVGVVLTLGAGSRSGIGAGMVVAWRTTVVGRVIEPVGPFSADVELITANDAALQARFKSPPNADGPSRAFTRRVEPGEDGLTFTADVERDLDVRVGDLAVLADELQYGEARGMLLGRVTRVTDYLPDPLMLKRLVITPDVDPRRLGEVAVLVPAR